MAPKILKIGATGTLCFGTSGIVWLGIHIKLRKPVVISETFKISTCRDINYIKFDFPY